MTAERMQSRHYEPRKKAYRTMLNTMERMIVAGSLNCERVEIPYGGTSFPALFVGDTELALDLASFFATASIASRR